MFLFVVSVSLAVSCFQDLIAGPASPGLMLNAAAVWQWGMKPERAEPQVGLQRHFACGYAVAPKVLYTEESWMSRQYWFTKPVFECPEKVRLKLELRRRACWSRAHPGGSGSWPCLAPERLAPKLGFSSRASQGWGGIPHVSITVIWVSQHAVWLWMTFCFSPLRLSVVVWPESARWHHSQQLILASTGSMLVMACVPALVC